MTDWTMTGNSIFARHVMPKIIEALDDTRVVMISGPRQAGKTTLAQQFTDNGRKFVTLDDPVAYDSALSDPIGFVRQYDYVTIDEIQRVPDLLPVIKMSVDSDQRPGRFLLTGSANILTIPKVAESMAGRMSVKKLLPLSQCEIERKPNDLLGRLFECELPSAATETFPFEDIAFRVLAGGYPEMLLRRSAARRTAWANSYIETLISRDIKDIVDTYRLNDITKLLQASAIQSAQLIVHTKIANALGISIKTAQRYLNTLEHMYLLALLPAWHGNALKRLVRTPKLHFLDTGLLGAIRNISHDTLETGRASFGAMLASFVFSELLKQAACSVIQYSFSHYRDKDKIEVDFVIERSPAELIGVEVKSSATVKSEDFKGLRKLRSAVGKAFRSGTVLYAGDKAYPFGDRLMAVPLAALWA